MPRKRKPNETPVDLSQTPKKAKIYNEAGLKDFNASYGLTDTGISNDIINDAKSIEDSLTQVQWAQIWLQNTTEKSVEFTKPRKYKVLDTLGKREASLRAAKEQCEQAAEDARNATSRSKQPSGAGNEPGANGNGKCYITFVNVGLGDCTVITTPRGFRIMIDCGSDALTDVILDPFKNPNDRAEKAARDVNARASIKHSVLSDTFLNGEAKLGMLLLTHPDQDHINLLKEMLDVQTIDIAYFGGAERFDAYRLPDIRKIAKSIQYVILRDDEKDKKTVVKKIGKEITKPIKGKATKVWEASDITDASGASQNTGTPYIDPATSAIVLYYETSQEGQVLFRLSLLAANVTGVWQDGAFKRRSAKVKADGEMKLGATEQNTRSLAVLVESYDSVFLICGDATAVTETFMRSRFGKVLQKVTHLRLGHHGSATSSARKFIAAMTNLKVVVASSGGRYTDKHALPKKRILAEYLASLNVETADPHSIYSFDTKSSKKSNTDPYADVQFRAIKKELWATGSSGNGTRHFILEKAAST